MDTTFKNYFKRNLKSVMNSVMSLFSAVDSDLDDVNDALGSLYGRVTTLENNPSGSGDVNGPSSATANGVVIFDGTTGKAIKNSGYTIGKSVPSDAKFTDTTYSSKTASSGGTDVSLVTTDEKYTWNNKTSNTGTVTSVATGAGLTGGTITGSGTIKADLKSETKSSLTAAARGSTSGREYPVGLDANGDLSVNVPWTDTNIDTHHTSYTYVGASSTATANATASNGSVYLNHVENGSVRNSHKISGSGLISVTSDSSGNISIGNASMYVDTSTGNLMYG